MSVKATYRFLTLAVAALLMAVAWGCSSKKSDSGRPTVAVNYESQRWLVEQIAGTDFDVAVLLPPGRDPETYDPDMRVMERLSDAGVYLTTSTLGFESVMKERVGSNLPDLKVADISRGISFITDTHTHSHSHGAHDSHAATSADPHLLSSLRNASVMAGNIADELSALRPERKEVYAANLARLQSRFAARDKEIDSLLNLPGAARAAAVTHPALSYFARDYGLRQVALERDGKEASPRQLRDRIEEAHDAGARTLFYEKGHDEERMRELAASMGMDAIPVYFDGADFEEVTLRVARRLAK